MIIINEPKMEVDTSKIIDVGNGKLVIINNNITTSFDAPSPLTPLIDFEYQPPPTRKERRKQNRKKRKK